MLVTLQKRESIVPSFHRQNTINGIKKFLLRRKFKVAALQPLLTVNSYYFRQQYTLQCLHTDLVRKCQTPTLTVRSHRWVVTGHWGTQVTAVVIQPPQTPQLSMLAVQTPPPAVTSSLNWLRPSLRPWLSTISPPSSKCPNMVVYGWTALFVWLDYYKVVSTLH